MPQLARPCHTKFIRSKKRQNERARDRGRDRKSEREKRNNNAPQHFVIHFDSCYFRHCHITCVLFEVKVFKAYNANCVWSNSVFILSLCTFIYSTFGIPIDNAAYRISLRSNSIQFSIQSKVRAREREQDKEEKKTQHTHTTTNNEIHKFCVRKAWADVSFEVINPMHIKWHVSINLIVKPSNSK